MATRPMTTTRKTPTGVTKVLPTTPPKVRKTKPSGQRYSPTRSFRVSQQVWDKAKLRADADGQTMSKAVALLLEAYAEGLIALPTPTLSYPE